MTGTPTYKLAVTTFFNLKGDFFSFYSVLHFSQFPLIWAFYYYHYFYLFFLRESVQFRQWDTYSYQAASTNSTEITVMDQLRTVGSRGHEAHNKSCSWPSRIILWRVSFERYSTHKAGTRAVAFVSSAWWEIETGMLQIPCSALSSAGWKP